MEEIDGINSDQFENYFEDNFQFLDCKNEEELCTLLKSYIQEIHSAIQKLVGLSTKEMGFKISTCGDLDFGSCGYLIKSEIHQIAFQIDGILENGKVIENPPLVFYPRLKSFSDEKGPIVYLYSDRDSEEEFGILTSDYDFIPLDLDELKERMQKIHQALISSDLFTENNLSALLNDRLNVVQEIAQIGGLPVSGEKKPVDFRATKIQGLIE